MRTLGLCLLGMFCFGCGDGVKSDEDARRAYLGLDAHVDKAITLGFVAFNKATSANIQPESAPGAKQGTLTINGQIDQGSSANKGMRLKETLSMYSDDGLLVYDTDPAVPPALDLSLKAIPTGTLSGSLIGSYAMTGELEGTVTLDLAFAGELQAGANNTVERKPGSTRITGSATSPAGAYTVDLTR